jgi:hypothetical protein
VGIDFSMSDTSHVPAVWRPSSHAREKTAHKPVLALTTTVLRAQATRSFLISILAPVPDLSRGDVAIFALAGMAAVAGIVVSSWSVLGESRRLERLVTRAQRWPYDQPIKLWTRSAVVAGVLATLPLSVLLAWVTVRGGEALGLEAGIAFGSLSGLLIGLAFLRLRLAHAVSRYETDADQVLIVDGLGLRRRIGVWLVSQ